MTDQLIVIGAGGHAKVVIATARAAGWTVTAAYDDDPSKQGGKVLGVPVRGAVSEVAGEGAAVLAFGNNRVRHAVARRLRLDWRSLIHPHALVADGAEIAPGTVVFAGAVVQPDTRLGEHVIVNTGATIDHDCVVDAFCHVAPGAHLAGEVCLGEGAFAGIGATLNNGVSVGPWSIVGAGAAVTRDVPAETTVVGVPARPLAR